ncbi:MAG: helix-turn-helix transcriptional regulator [Chloroflexi bacterium]|nr:MAG: helix-turn-helix transcriptional regulator [Chloroflexota bacterium]TMD53713.1 MAG: helix-turn-helix transcriptional regulator [Chloroflexota bacterium]
MRLLVRGLLNQARASPAPVPVSGPDLSVAPELVVLDTELDGLRLLLIRTDRAESERPPLSPREREIARMVARGLPNKAIAAVLDISSWTVSTHLRRMFAKYHVSSRAAMIARLVEEGLLH